MIALASVALKVNALDKDGFISAILIGFLLVLGGGLSWLLLGTAFLIMAIPLTKLNYDKKKAISAAEKNYGARGWRNIFANGGVASIAAVLSGLFGGGVFAAAFVGAIATAAADTLATEVGLLSKMYPRSMTNFQKTVSPGTSGGITKLGLLASFFTALFIGILAALLNIGRENPYKFLMIGMIVGFAGSLVDSLMGATIQRKNRCTSCSIITEYSTHHEIATKHESGIRCIDNNVINFFSTAIASLIAVWFFVFL